MSAARPSNTAVTLSPPTAKKSDRAPVAQLKSAGPTDQERARLKREHQIAWHPTGGWCRKFPGDLNRTYFGKVTAAAAVRAMHDEENRRKRGEQTAAKIQNLIVRDAANLFLTHLDGELEAG